jgi:rhomboid protease GluP
MALGPNPKFVEERPLNGLPPQAAVVLALEAASLLGWEIHYLSETGLLAGMRKKPAQLQIRINGDRMQVLSHSLLSELWDGGRNKKHVQQFWQRYEELRTKVPWEAVVERYYQIAPSFVAPQWDALRRPQRKETGIWSDLRAVFTAGHGYVATPLILSLNLLVFLMMVIGGVSVTEPDSASLIAWGANGPQVFLGEWWRLLTAVFVHIGIVHLMMNMYAFVLIGTQLEPRLGSARFGFAYLLSGLASSGFSLWWHGGAHLSAGASGAIFGMYGVFVPLLLTDLVEERNRRQLRASMLFFIGYNLLGGIAPGIDNAGHIGGLVTGLMLGLAFMPSLRRKKRQALAVQQIKDAEAARIEEQRQLQQHIVHHGDTEKHGAGQSRIGGAREDYY